MTFVELFIIAVGLSMDAFAVAICKGLTNGKVKFKEALTVGLYFGVFQGGMPLIGYLLGINFHKSISSIDHWIAFVLLGIIGINMIREAKSSENQCDLDTQVEDSFSVKNMLVLSVATSIDALAIGISFAFLNVKILDASISIGLTTLILSFFGVYIGGKFGAKFKSKAEYAGGIILILMGSKILLEHLGMLG